MLFNKIIIWGHKLHTHTHSYIHYGFYKAFKYLNYDILWLDNNDNINNIDFHKCLFITEGQVDRNIPIIEDSIYILHNCDGNKYKNIKYKFNLQVITKADLNRYKFYKIPNEYGYYHSDLLMICWATDLLPDEINKNIEKVKNDEINSENELYFIGMMLDVWDKVSIWCNNNNIKFINKGGFSNNVSSEENMVYIQKSILAPAIQNKWQVDNGYIPCRIFKNISYGKMGLTNNLFVNELFNNELIYDNDIDNLLNKGLLFNKNIFDKNIFNNKNKLIKLMEYVRDNHTYINRINALLWFLQEKINL
jgi:hypothetical protein